MKTLLIVEPGIRSYKEHIVESLHALTDVNLIVAVGLRSILDCSWIEKYVTGVIDFSYSNDTLISAVDSYLLRTGIKLDGVLTYVEPSVHYANKLAHHLGLPVVSGYCDKSVRSKSKIRQRLREGGVPQIWFQTIENEAQMESLLGEGLKFPVIVKPAEMMSSLGVTLAKNEAELRVAFHKARGADFWDENLRTVYTDLSSEVICEEYIEGPEYSVEIATTHGTPHILGVTKKWTGGGGFFDETGHCFPAPDIAPEMFAKIDALVRQSHAALKIQNSITHAEFRIRDGVPHIIEINCRLAGDFISEIMARSTGLSIGALLRDVHCGELVTFSSTKKEVHSVSFLSTEKEGRILQIDEKRLASTLTEFRRQAEMGDLLYRGGLVGLGRLATFFTEGEPFISPDLEQAFIIQPALSIEPLTKSSDTMLVFASAPGDLSHFVEIENQAWEPAQRASAEVLKTRLELHPQTQFLAFSLELRSPVGFISAVPIEKGANGTRKPWLYYAGRALTPNQQKGPAETLYIVSISVLPDAPRGTGTALVRAVAKYCEAASIQYLRYGIRVPKYSQHVLRGVDFPAYFQGLLERRYHEDLMSLANNSGGVAVAYLENYFADPPSLNWGVLIEHRIGGTK